MRTEPDNCTPRLLPPARSGEGQYCAILASLQAVRPRCAAGAAPGPRLRVPHAPNTPETTRKTVTTTTNPALTSSAASGMTPRKEDVVRRVLAHHSEQTRQALQRAHPLVAPGYRPESMDVLFGNRPS